MASFSLFGGLMGAPQQMQMGPLAQLMNPAAMRAPVPARPDPRTNEMQGQGQPGETRQTPDGKTVQYVVDPQSGQGKWAEMKGNFGRNVKDLFSPENLSAWGAMAGGRTFGDSLGGFLQQSGQNLSGMRETRKAEAQKNKTLAWLQSKNPEIAQAVEMGVLPIGEAYKAMKGDGGQGLTDDIKEYQYAVQNGMYKGSFPEWQTKGVREQDPTFGREMDLRGQYDSLPEVKDYKVVKSNYERIRQGTQLGTGAGDAAIVFGYMKMLDPTSVVREGEQASARNAAGVPEQVRGLYNQITGGGTLSDEARAQILAAADQVYSESLSNVEGVNQRYGGIADQYRLDRGRIVTPTERYEPLAVGKAKDLGNGVTIRRTK